MSEIDFGDYVQIEQKRYGVPNEMFLHKVIGAMQSNSYVNVPVQVPATETILNHGVVDVVACICCGIDETKVLKYRIEDVRLVGFAGFGFKSTEQPSAVAAVEPFKETTP